MQQLICPQCADVIAVFEGDIRPSSWAGQPLCRACILVELAAARAEPND